MISPYSRSYAVGYYYGRANFPEGTTMDAIDSLQKESTEFKKGFKDGQYDFQEIDLVAESLSTQMIESE